MLITERLVDVIPDINPKKFVFDFFISYVHLHQV